jgi:tetratricopeptide (TPR) repeat protein
MKANRQSVEPPSSPEPEETGIVQSDIKIGDVNNNVGVAIGPGARAIGAKAEGAGAVALAVYINSLLDINAFLNIFKQHWLFLLLSLVLQGTIVGFWWHYADRFMISASVLLIGMGLIETGLVIGQRMKVQPGYRLQLFLGLVLTGSAFTGLVGALVGQILNPPKFPKEAFGVAVALFGDGPEFSNTPRARDVSQLVLQQLKQQYLENSNLQFVQFAPIGLVRTQTEAYEDGERIGADLVIWGKLDISEDKTILNFSILETPDKVSNPRFPRVLPFVNETANSSFVNIGSQGSEDIAKGATKISAFTFGLAHFFKLDFRSAARAFNEAPLASPETNDNYTYLLHLYYGLSLQALGELDKSNIEFQKAIDLRPEDPAPRIARAFTYNASNRVKDAQGESRIALKLCTDRIKLEPNDFTAYFDRALANDVLQDWESALGDYQSAREKEPNLYIAYLGIVRMQLTLNRVQDAIQAAQDAITLAESKKANPAWAYAYLAYSYESEMDTSNARFNYQKATSLAPEADYIHFLAGNFYARTENAQDLQVAEQEYKAIIRVSSNPAWGHTILADFYKKQNRLEDAAAEYRAALQTEQDVGGHWVALAQVLEQLGQTGDARKAYDRAVELEPGSFYAQYAYGNFLFIQGELEAAIRQWELANQINPQNCGLLVNIGRAYEMLGDQKQADALFLDALSNSNQPDQACQIDAKRRLDHVQP